LISGRAVAPLIFFLNQTFLWKLMVSLFAMSTSTFQQPHMKKPAPDPSARITGGNGKQEARNPRAKDREPALREADRIIEKLEESYSRSGQVLRSLNNIGSKF